MRSIQNRRRFVAGLSAVCAAGLASVPTSTHAEPAPVTTTVRLPRTFRAVCESGN